MTRRAYGLMLLICGIAGFLGARAVFAVPLDSWATWAGAQPQTARQVPPYALVARGTGTNTYYVLEVDPTTGNIPVSATATIESAGTPGAAVPSKADFVAGTDGTNLRGLKTDTAGKLQVDVVTSGLPSGAATDAKQDTGNSSLASIDGGIPAALGQTTMAASMPVTIASNQSSITTSSSNWPSTVDTNTGAAGASTPRIVLATRHEAVATPLACTLSNGSAAIAYDSGASGATVPRVVLATRHEAVATPLAVQLSNGSAAVAYDAGASGSTVPRVTEASHVYADSARQDYSGGSVTTAAWTQLIASTAAAINILCVTDQSGQVMELGTGGAGVESRVLLIPRGFSACIPLRIAASTRIAVKAVSATASSGDLVISGMN